MCVSNITSNRPYLVYMCITYTVLVKKISNMVSPTLTYNTAMMTTVCIGYTYTYHPFR